MISIGMSTSCVYPLGMEQAFRLARLAGYDGVEVMITNDPTTQDADALLRLSERYSISSRCTRRSSCSRPSSTGATRG